MEFKKYKISDVAEVIGGGTPSTKKAEYYGSDIPWITPKDLSNHKKRYITYGERSITNLGLQKSSAKLLPTNTVLFTSRAPIGYVAIAGNQISTNQGFKSLICNENLILPEYMYYLMKFSTPDIENLATGSTFKEVSGSIIKNFEIELPNIIEQEKIINILSSLDSKIELNLDIIHNLEKISQTLFKNWFIDFEFPNEEGLPYKSSGGEMVESELGEIPKLFKWKLLNEICEVKDGTHDSPKQVDVGYPLVTSKHLKNNEIEFNTTKLISETDFIKVNKRSLVEYKDILISMIGTVGRLYFVQEKNINYAIKNIGLIKSSQTDFSEYIYMYFKSPSMINYIKERMTGSTQQYISLTELRKIPILRPNKEIIDLYLEKSSVNFDMIHNLILENQNLQQLRDTLLPKLLSGEIEIPDDLEV